MHVALRFLNIALYDPNLLEEIKIK